MYIVIAKTTDHQTIVDSIWDQQRAAIKRSNELYDYPNIFLADVREYELNKISEDLEYDTDMSDYEYGDFNEFN